MASGDTYGSRVAEAHMLGDLHVHGINSPGGYWASWDCANVTGKDSGSLIERLKKINVFLEGVMYEWHGFQRLTSLDSLFDETGSYSESLGTFIDDVERGISTKGSHFHIFLSIGYHIPRDEPHSPFINEFFETLKRGFGGMKRSQMIIPIVIVSDAKKWPLTDELPLYEAASTLSSPIFIKTVRHEGDTVSNPWIDGCVSGINTGVIGAITPNLPRAAYDAESEDSFIERVEELVDISIDGLEARRTHLEGELRAGCFPITATQITTFDDYFGALNVVGVHEALLNLLETGIDSMQGKAVAYRIIETIRERLNKHEEETGHRFCLGALPSNGASYRLAEIDKKKYPDIITSGVEAPFYTNSTCLPADYTDDLWDALEHQKKLQAFYSGGTIFNIYLRKGISDPAECGTLARRVLERSSVPCFAFSPSITASNVGAERYERLGFTYSAVSELGAGEKEEVRLRRPYAVVSGW
jgi:hypothetical protein